MKKVIATLMVLVMMAAAGVAALAEENTFSFREGVTFGMKMDQVIAAETGRYEIDKERTHGPVDFDELEYENILVDGKPADLTYLFINDALVAIRVSFEERAVTFDQAKADLAAISGETAPVDLNKLGNGIYAVDDDGRLEAKAEEIVSGNLMIILEADEDDVDVTFIDLSAAYISAK